MRATLMVLRFFGILIGLEWESNNLKWFCFSFDCVICFNYFWVLEGGREEEKERGNIIEEIKEK